MSDTEQKLVDILKELQLSSMSINTDLPAEDNVKRLTDKLHWAEVQIRQLFQPTHPVDRKPQWPTCSFDYKGKQYVFPFKLGCVAGITLTFDNNPQLIGGYTEKEIIDAIENGTLKPEVAMHPVDGELNEELLLKVDRLLEEIVVPVVRAAANGVDATALATVGSQKLTRFIQAAVQEKEEDLLHRVADVLSWHVAQGNIVPKNRSVEQIMQQLKKWTIKVVDSNTYTIVNKGTAK